MRWQGKVESVRRVLLEWAGVDLTGLVASTSCDTPLCVARRHVVAKTRKEAQQRVVGQPVSLLRRLRLSKANARNYRYTDEQVRLARTMPGTQREVAAVLGIPQSTVSKYRRSITRRMGDPMAQLLMVGGVR
jgi:DNA-binding NarL/FixJ family response regulator